MNDAWSRGEDPGSYRICIGERGHCLHRGGTDSSEERGVSNLPPKGASVDGVEAVPLSAGLS